MNGIHKNEIFTNANIKIIRPGLGLNPKYYEKIIGKTSKKNLKVGTPLQLKMIKKF